MFKLIQMCSTEFTVYTEFIVHSAGLSVNLAGLSVKSVGIRRLEISLFIILVK
jgi:hypothetical protein